MKTSKVGGAAGEIQPFFVSRRLAQKKKQIDADLINFNIGLCEIQLKFRFMNRNVAKAHSLMDYCHYGALAED
ncbi:MAG: hypothetical protein C0433_10185 [Cyclobacterium sp.]|nr:hypothetical protein [Cyclobacterium sp.]